MNREEYMNIAGDLEYEMNIINDLECNNSDISNNCRKIWRQCWNYSAAAIKKFTIKFSYQQKFITVLTFQIICILYSTGTAMPK